MSNIEFYQIKAEQYRRKQKQYTRKRNLVTIFKLLTFTSLVGILYLLLVNYSLYLLSLFVVDLFFFLILSKIDSYVQEKVELYRMLTSCCELELRALNGDFKALDGKAEYASSSHYYANDLDLFGTDSLFQHLNRTVTRLGEYALRDSLLCLLSDKRSIEREREAAREWAGKMETALLFRATGLLHPVSLADMMAVIRWSKHAAFFRRKSAVFLLYISNFLVLAAWLMAFAALLPYGVATFLSLGQLLALSFRLKQINAIHRDLSASVATLRNYRHLICILSETNFESLAMSQLQLVLFAQNNALVAFGSLDRLLAAFEQRQNVLVSFLLNALLLYDFHHIRLLDAWRLRYSDDLVRWIDAVSQIDKWISMGIYRFNHTDFVDPLIDDEAVLQATRVAHPLLPSDGRVVNDFELQHLGHLAIVTGANMAGKSTFLRTIGCNLVLALSGNVVCAQSFRCVPFALFTSMRTTDNLAEGTSYFHAELLRLRALVEALQCGGRWFVILDEMLKGTNSKDKLNGSQAFLQKIVEYPLTGLIATHDLELAERAQADSQHYLPACFEITHQGDEICYDYRLRKGISSTMNATFLMKRMGLID